MDAEFFGAPAWAWVQLCAAVFAISTAGVMFQQLPHVPPLLLASWRMQATALLLLAAGAASEWRVADGDVRAFKTVAQARVQRRIAPRRALRRVGRGASDHDAGAIPAPRVHHAALPRVRRARAVPPDVRRGARRRRAGVLRRRDGRVRPARRRTGDGHVARGRALVGSCVTSRGYMYKWAPEACGGGRRSPCTPDQSPPSRRCARPSCPTSWRTTRGYGGVPPGWAFSLSSHFLVTMYLALVPGARGSHGYNAVLKHISPLVVSTSLTMGAVAGERAGVRGGAGGRAGVANRGRGRHHRRVSRHRHCRGRRRADAVLLVRLADDH